MSTPSEYPMHRRTIHLIVNDDTFQPLPELTEEEKVKYTEFIDKMVQDFKDFKSDKDLLTGTK
jgi:hypothetical protein